jgi:chromosome segregation ATPase
MTTPSVPDGRTSRALAARRGRTDAALTRLKGVLDHMAKSQTPITVAAVARSADVSRTFLYEHAEARALVDAAINQAAGRRVQDRHHAQDELEASWRERALNAEAALTTAHAEILAQPDQIAELIGQVRDLRSSWSEGDIMRIVTDNGNLKRQVRELTVEGKSLAARLTATRDNLRFADKRIADLEVQLTEQNQDPMCCHHSNLYPASRS